MIPGLPVSSIPQCKWNRHEGPWVELFQAIGRFESTFIEAHPASKTISKVRSLTSRIKTRSFLEEIIPSSSEVLKHCESGIAVGIRKLDNPTSVTAECKVIVQQIAGP